VVLEGALDPTALSRDGPTGGESRSTLQEDQPLTQILENQ